MKNEAEQKRLDRLNNERVETAKKRVAHAIRLIKDLTECVLENHDINYKEDYLPELAHATNLLEAGSQELKWACEHFCWDDSIVYELDKACRYLGYAMSEIVYDECDCDIDYMSIGCNAETALAIMGKSLATLVRWFDDDQDVSEI